MSVPRLAVVGLFLIVHCCVPGCGGGKGGRASLYGTVKFDGKPVENGSIAFIPAEGVVGPSTGASIENGKYQTPAEQGPVVGKHRVEITAMRSTGKTDVKGVAGSAATGPSAGGAVNNLEMYIPDQYNKKSNLSLVVKPGSNQENFDLKSK